MERVRYERQGAVGVVTLDDGKANAIQDEFLAGLGAALDRAQADDEVGALLVAGRPGCFSGGLDLKTLPALPRAALRATCRRFGEGMLRLAAFPKPVVAAVSGHALAGGCVLLLCCDFRLGAAGPFRIGLNEVAIALPLPTFVIELARDALAPAALHEALLTGRAYDPEAAVRAGYLHEVHAAEALFDRALERAQALASLPGAAFAETKRRVKAEALRRGAATNEAELGAFFAGPFAAAGGGAD